jgi:hypothetical protein
MTVKLLLVVWCSASLLAGGGLVVWFAVEMKILAHWLRDRVHARRAQARLPKARILTRKRATHAPAESTSTPDRHE